MDWLVIVGCATVEEDEALVVYTPGTMSSSVASPRKNIKKD